MTAPQLGEENATRTTNITAGNHDFDATSKIESSLVVLSVPLKTIEPVLNFGTFLSSYFNWKCTRMTQDCLIWI